MKISILANYTWTFDSTNSRDKMLFEDVVQNINENKDEDDEDVTLETVTPEQVRDEIEEMLGNDPEIIVDTFDINYEVSVEK